MEDTPQHIKDLQLKIWLSKTRGERLYQTLKSNEELFLFWKEAKAAKKIDDTKKTRKFSKHVALIIYYPA